MHRSTSSTIRTSYDGLNRRRSGLSTTSGSSGAAALRLASPVPGALPFSSEALSQFKHVRFLCLRPTLILCVLRFSRTVGREGKTFGHHGPCGRSTYWTVSDASCLVSSRTLLSLVQCRVTFHWVRTGGSISELGPELVGPLLVERRSQRVIARDRSRVLRSTLRPSCPSRVDLAAHPPAGVCPTSGRQTIKCRFLRSPRISTLRRDGSTA